MDYFVAVVFGVMQKLKNFTLCLDPECLCGKDLIKSNSSNSRLPLLGCVPSWDTPLGGLICILKDVQNRSEG